MLDAFGLSKAVLIGTSMGGLIATKFGHRVGAKPNEGGQSRKWIFQDVEDSLQYMFARMAGLGDIHLMSADTSAPRVTMHAIRNPDEVQSTLRRVAHALAGLVELNHADVAFG